MISLLAATLKNGTSVRPVAHINTESKRGWHEITDAIPQFASMPAPAEFPQLISAPAPAAAREPAQLAGG